MTDKASRPTAAASWLHLTGKRKASHLGPDFSVEPVTRRMAADPACAEGPAFQRATIDAVGHSDLPRLGPCTLQT